MMSNVDTSIFDFILSEDSSQAVISPQHSRLNEHHNIKEEPGASPLLKPPRIPFSLPNDQHLLDSSLVHSPPDHLSNSPPPTPVPRDDLSPIDVPMLSLEIRQCLLSMIAEYLNEAIALKPFLQKVRAQCCTESNSDVFSWMLRSILECGQTHRMTAFLEENGVRKEEIEAASVRKRERSTLSEEEDEFGIGEKRKRRERKRVSISRGLRSPPNKWSKAESQRLIRLVFEFGDKSWKKIAEQLGGGKTGAQCAQHWKRVLSPEIRKGSWDDQEETLLFSLVQKHGQSWKNIAAEIKTRTDIQCRYQYQKACLSRQCEWLPQEDALLKKKIALCGQERKSVNWIDVSKFIARAKLTKIPRTALECKDRWQHVNHNATLIYNNMIAYQTMDSKQSSSPNSQSTASNSDASPIMVC